MGQDEHSPGAEQKNLGPAGISLVIVRRHFLATRRQGLPPLADYQTFEREGSMYNTPNTFGRSPATADLCPRTPCRNSLAFSARSSRSVASVTAASMS